MNDWISYLKECINSDLWGFVLLDYYHKGKTSENREDPSHFIDSVLSEMPKAEIDPVAFHNVLLSVCVQLLGNDFYEIMKKSINLLKDIKTPLSENQIQSILLQYDVYGKREVFMERLAEIKETNESIKQGSLNVLLHILDDEERELEKKIEEFEKPEKKEKIIKSPHRNIDDLNSLKKELKVHKKNLARLNLQKARYGSLDVPLHISNQIDDEENAIKKLERRIKEVELQATKGRVALLSPIPHGSIDNFFGQKQDVIKKLAQRFATYLNRTPPITEDIIKAWLLQFGKIEWIALALKLLEQVDYYTQERMQDMFRHFYENIIKEEDRNRVIISLLGDLKDSASIVTYVLGEVFMKYKLSAQPLETILNNIDPNDKVIVFVDDNIGSGKQAVQIFRDWLGIKEEGLKEHHVMPLSKEQIEIFKQFKIYLSTFVGFEEGKERVCEELKALGLNIEKIYSFGKLEEKIGCFHPASDRFDNPEEREKAKDMAKEIGMQLLADKHWSEELRAERSLGYGNSQKLIVFFYNTPTSTLPILWKKGAYNGKSWQPLFPRRQKM